MAVSEVVDQMPDLPVDVVKGPGGVVTGAGSPYSIVPTPSLKRPAGSTMVRDPEIAVLARLRSIRLPAFLGRGR